VAQLHFSETPLHVPDPLFLLQLSWCKHSERLYRADDVPTVLQAKPYAQTRLSSLARG